MRFDSVFLDELRMKNDIESVVAPYVSLRRSGRLLSGLCPFHGERSPSFYIYPETQSYYCFGCGAGGDVITFIRTIENLSYVDAVKLLANRAGMRLPDVNADDGTDKLRKRCFAANREAARFFNAVLFRPEGKAGLDYLLGRGLTAETIRRFGLGFAPAAWDALSKHLRSLGYRDDELVQFYLARKSQKGTCYDAFRNRVIFPIIDVQGNVVAFGGRVMDDSKPKYLNSSDTPVYKKSRGVFALNFAKNHAGKKLILCEGYMDVIALHQAGFTNAVAGLGTALTQEQALLLSRYADDIYICYDSDEPGVKAAAKAVELFAKTNVRIKVLRVTGGKDPDEVLRKYGPERMRAILDGAMNDIEFRLSGAKNGLDLTTEDGKLLYANASVKILAAVANPLECDLYASKLAAETGINRDVIIEQIRRERKSAGRHREQERFAQVVRQSTGYTKSEFYPSGTPPRVRFAEETLLASLLRNPDFIAAVRAEVSETDFVSDTNRRIFAVLEKNGGTGTAIGTHLFHETLDTAEMGHLSYLLTKSSSLGNSLAECRDCIRSMKEGKKLSLKTDASKLSDREFLELFKRKSDN